MIWRWRWWITGLAFNTGVAMLGHVFLDVPSEVFGLWCAAASVGLFGAVLLAWVER